MPWGMHSHVAGSPARRWPCARRVWLCRCRRRPVRDCMQRRPGVTLALVARATTKTKHLSHLLAHLLLGGEEARCWWRGILAGCGGDRFKFACCRTGAVLASPRRATHQGEASPGASAPLLKHSGHAAIAKSGDSFLHAVLALCASTPLLPEAGRDAETPRHHQPCKRSPSKPNSTQQVFLADT